MTFTNVFGGDTIRAAQQSYAAYTIATDLTLYWPVESVTSGNVVANQVDVTASTGGLSVIMPDATQGSIGAVCNIQNVGVVNSFTVKDSAGGTIHAVATGAVYLLVLTSNSTVAGTWEAIALGSGSSSVSPAALAGGGLQANGATLQVNFPITAKTINYTVATSDRGVTLVWTGGAGVFTLPSSTSLGNGFNFYVNNGGSGAVTLTPSGSDTIDAAATMAVNPGQSVQVIADGASAFWTIGFGYQPTTNAMTRLVKDVSASGTITLSAAEAGNAQLYFTGTLTGVTSIVVPATVAVYYVTNATSGAYTLTVKTSAGTGIVVKTGTARDILLCDGTNVVRAVDPLYTTLAEYGITNGVTTSTSVTTTAGITGGGALSSSLALMGELLPNVQTGTSYAIVAGDRGKLVTGTNAAAQAYTIPQATGSFGNGYSVQLQNRGAGVLTLTPTTSTIDGAATLVLLAGQGVEIASDGTNYYTQRGGATQGGWVLIQTQTASASATIDFTTGINSTFNNYAVVIDNLQLTGAGPAVCQVRWSEATVFQTTGYVWQLGTPNAGAPSTYAGSGSGSDSWITFCSSLTSTTSYSGVIYLQNRGAPPAGSQGTFLQGQGAISVNAALQILAGTRNTTAAVDGLRFAPASSTFAVGNFRLFGIRNS